MDLVEPEPQFRKRRRRTILNSIAYIGMTIAIIFLALIGIYVAYLGLEPFSPLYLAIFFLVIVGVFLLLSLLVVWSGAILFELGRLRPISISKDRITLNTRFTVDIKQIKGIDREVQWKTLRIKLTEPRVTIIIIENEFVSGILKEYKDRLSITNYVEDPGLILPC